MIKIVKVTTYYIDYLCCDCRKRVRETFDSKPKEKDIEPLICIRCGGKPCKKCNRGVTRARVCNRCYDSLTETQSVGLERLTRISRRVLIPYKIISVLLVVGLFLASVTMGKDDPQLGVGLIVGSIVLGIILYQIHKLINVLFARRVKRVVLHVEKEVKLKKASQHMEKAAEPTPVGIPSLLQVIEREINQKSTPEQHKQLLNECLQAFKEKNQELVLKKLDSLEYISVRDKLTPMYAEMMALANQADQNEYSRLVWVRERLPGILTLFTQIAHHYNWKTTQKNEK